MTARITPYTLETAVQDLRRRLFGDGQRTNLENLYPNSATNTGILSYVDLENDSSENQHVLAQAILALQIKNMPAILMVKDDAAAQRLVSANIPNLTEKDIVAVNDDSAAALQEALRRLNEKSSSDKSITKINYYSKEGLAPKLESALKTIEGLTVYMKGVTFIASTWFLYSVLDGMAVALTTDDITEAELDVYKKALLVARSV
jgi:CheY-like chemotaxis protein